MIPGNAGIVTVIVTTTSSYVTSKGYKLPINVLTLLVGTYVIYRVVTRKKLMRKWESFVENKLTRSATFEEAATEDLPPLMEGYGLGRAIVKNFSVCWRFSSECRLTGEGLLVLGIERGKNLIPIPKTKEGIQEDDRLVVYGPLDILKTLFREDSSV